MSTIIRYLHHGLKVYVDEALQGKHREHCLCYKCEKFNPLDRHINCRIANALYDFDVQQALVTPVWECVVFVEKDKKDQGTVGPVEPVIGRQV